MREVLSKKAVLVIQKNMPRLSEFAYHGVATFCTVNPKYKILTIVDHREIRKVIDKHLRLAWKKFSSEHSRYCAEQAMLANPKFIDFLESAGILDTLETPCRLIAISNQEGNCHRLCIQIHDLNDAMLKNQLVFGKTIPLNEILRKTAD